MMFAQPFSGMMPPAGSYNPGYNAPGTGSMSRQDLSPPFLFMYLGLSPYQGTCCHEVAANVSRTNSIITALDMHTAVDMYFNAIMCRFLISKRSWCAQVLFKLKCFG